MPSIDWNGGMNALVSLELHLRQLGSTMKIDTLVLRAKEYLTKAANSPDKSNAAILNFIITGEKIILLAQFLNERVANAQNKMRSERNPDLARNWKAVAKARNSALIALLGCEFNSWYEKSAVTLSQYVQKDLRQRFTSARIKIDRMCIIARDLDYTLSRIKGQHFSVIGAFPSDLDHQGRFVIGRAVSEETGKRTYFLLELPFPFEKDESEGEPIIVHTEPLSRSKFARTLYSFGALKREE